MPPISLSLPSPSSFTVPRRWRATAAAGSLVLVGACMTSVENGASIDSTNEVVTFDGITLDAGLVVEVQASASPAGPFSGWPGSTAVSSANPLPFSLPTGSGQSAPAYGWSTSAAIPADRWGTVVEADGCAHPVSYVRARSGAISMLTFDAPTEDDPGGLACALDTVLSGGTVIDVVGDCTSADSPVARVNAPLVHVGDVVIDGPAAAAAFACVGVIEGSLQVELANPVAVALPRLQRVTGDVTLGLAAQAVAPYDDTRCGSALPSQQATVIASVQLPTLTAIGGDLSITENSSGVPTTFGERIELGLDALTSLGGDLLLSFDIPAVAPCGLSSLSEVTGDLALSFGGADTGGLFLDTLTRVDGEASITGSFTTLNLLPSLASAGSLSVTDVAQLSPTSMSQLTTVDGLVRLEDVGFFGQLLPALAQAETLELHDTGLPALSLVGANPVAIEGLSITDNAGLSSLLAGGVSPVSPSSGAMVTVFGNPSLDAAEVCDFVAVLSSSGWVGAADLGGIVCP